MIRSKVLLLSLLLSQSAFANTAPPSHIYLPQITLDVTEHLLDYSHFEFIGVCTWLSWSWDGPNIETLPEVDEYLPDLIATVYNEADDDPWGEVNLTIDKVGFTAGNTAAIAAFGYGLGNGQVSSVNNNNKKDNDQITKYVDIIGNPTPLGHVPFILLRSDTTPYLPYYLSDADIPGRLGIAEALYPASWNPFDYYIGQSALHKWGYEYPRSMTSITTNDYTASVMSALRGADIVTNNNFLHVVKSTNDSCGVNCAVANVIEEPNDDHEIWQEVYPLNRHITLGEDATNVSIGHSLGEQDEAAGNGNYVFVIWRHYRGCVQGDGDLIFATTAVPPTQKR